MTLAGMGTMDLVGALLGFFLTVSVFSYLFGDNGLFRLALHLFIGVAAGFAAIMAWYNVIWPQMLMPFFSGNLSEMGLALIPLVLGLFLLTKALPRSPGWANWVVAILVGIGAAAALSGAVIGTLYPQSLATINMFDPEVFARGDTNFAFNFLNAALFLVGALSTLAYFHFGVRQGNEGVATRGSLVEGVAWIGQIFIAIALGALFAGVYAAAVVALIERLSSIVDVVRPLIFP